LNIFLFFLQDLDWFHHWYHYWPWRTSV
jgi:hypothetical protein